MTIRRNGYSMLGKENFQGNPGFFTLIADAVGVKMQDTGVVQPLVEFKRSHTKPLYNVVDGSWGDISLLDESVRTFHGAVVATDADYQVAYFRQLNVNRVVDAITQRAVIIGTSNLALGNIGGATTANFNVALSTTDESSSFTFFAERFDVFVKEIADPATGVPSTPPVYHTDNALVDIFNTLPLFTDGGIEVVADVDGLASGVGAIVPGLGYTDLTGVPVGKGMVVNIVAVAGEVTAVTIVESGSGFADGEVVALTALGNGDATFAVAGVTSAPIARAVGVFDCFEALIK